jgi:hypothetical protein
MASLFEAGEQKTKEAIEASENRLLIAFHKWARPLEMPIRAHSMAIGAFDGEKENSFEQAAKLTDLERRVSKVEKESQTGFTWAVSPVRFGRTRSRGESAAP